MSDLVTNPEDRFSRITAHLIVVEIEVGDLMSCSLCTGILYGSSFFF